MPRQETAVAVRQDQSVAPSAFEKAIMFGDISGLDERGRVDYIARLCESLGLNPLGRAFAYINFGQGLTCYLTSMGASQLRTIHGVSITKVEDHGVVDGFYRITVTGGTLTGRTDIEFGSIAMVDKQGNTLVGVYAENARKKCLTQAKSRLTKSLVGLSGMPAEDEKDDFGERWSAGPTPESLAAHRLNQETGDVGGPEPVSAEQLAILRQAAEYLYNEFDEHCPSDAECASYTYDQAFAEIKRRRQLGARLKRMREAQATRPADPVVPQHSDDQLDVAFPEVPMHVGTP